MMTISLSLNVCIGRRVARRTIKFPSTRQCRTPRAVPAPIGWVLVAPNWYIDPKSIKCIQPMRAKGLPQLARCIRYSLGKKKGKKQKNVEAQTPCPMQDVSHNDEDAPDFMASNVPLPPSVCVSRYKQLIYASSVSWRSDSRVSSSEPFATSKRQDASLCLPI